MYLQKMYFVAKDVADHSGEHSTFRKELIKGFNNRIDALSALMEYETNDVLCEMACIDNRNETITFYYNDLKKVVNYSIQEIDVEIE